VSHDDKTIANCKQPTTKHVWYTTFELIKSSQRQHVMNIVLSALCSIFSVLPRLPVSSDVKSSRPKWPRGQNFGLSLGLEHLASDCPRSRCLIVVRMHPSDYSIQTFTVWLLCIRAFSGKIRVKFGNFGNFTGNNLKSYVVNHYLVLFHIFWPQQSALASTSRKPRPRPQGFGLV